MRIRGGAWTTSGATCLPAGCGALTPSGWADSRHRGTLTTPRTEHAFYVEEKTKRSTWLHPYDDPEYIKSLPKDHPAHPDSEAAQRAREQAAQEEALAKKMQMDREASKKGGKPAEKEEVWGPMGPGASVGGPAKGKAKNTEPDPDRNWFQRKKDQMIGTKEERVQHAEQKRKAKEEQRKREEVSFAPESCRDLQLIKLRKRTASISREGRSCCRSSSTTRTSVSAALASSREVRLNVDREALCCGPIWLFSSDRSLFPSRWPVLAYWLWYVRLRVSRPELILARLWRRLRSSLRWLWRLWRLRRLRNGRDGWYGHDGRYGRDGTRSWWWAAGRHADRRCYGWVLESRFYAELTIAGGGFGGGGFGGGGFDGGGGFGGGGGC